MDKVSVLLPVYNSISRIESDTIFSMMLDSILQQTHINFELIILDNQSTDNTVKLCKEKCESDKRVTIIVDNNKCSPEEAMNKLTPMATGEFITTLSDDDLLDKTYLEVLISSLNNNPTCDLAYSNGCFITSENRIGNKLIGNYLDGYKEEPYYINFYKAIHKRLVIPTLFGVFRSEVYKGLRPCIPFDTLQANMDNLMMAKFFLNKHNAIFCDKQLFYYRDRARTLNTATVKGMPNNPILIWVYYVKHQLNFYLAVEDIVKTTNHGKFALPLLIATLDSCLNQCWKLLHWVQRDLIKDAFENYIIQEIINHYLYIFQTKLKQMTIPIKYDEIEAMRVRCKIITNRILNYIEDVVVDPDIAKETQHLLQSIMSDLYNQYSTTQGTIQLSNNHL